VCELAADEKPNAFFRAERPDAQQAEPRDRLQPWPSAAIFGDGQWQA
jgi:hypothetical protein